mmetsp:Transcript_22821/g.50261  ORF Transcript_22821/g.50261 Transcript_22821/m.50261 type:complete len:495 (-) Transcript_22821:238-1722(-)
MVRLHGCKALVALSSLSFSSPSVSLLALATEAPSTPTTQVALPRVPGDTDFTEYNDELASLSRKLLNQVKVINDKYMQKMHTAICDKQQALYAAGLEHKVPVCQRVPAGFDKEKDCPIFTNALGKPEHAVLSSRCSDLLEEEYFFNTTMSFEKQVKDLQEERLSALSQESEAVQAEFKLHLQQAETAGAAMLEMESAPQKQQEQEQEQEGAQKAQSNTASGSVWAKREAQAWREEVHGQAQDFASKMESIISQLQSFRKATLHKVAADLNRTVTKSSTISRAELEQHTEAWDCWAKVDADVYDFTPWILSHPGGARLMTSRCGTDVTNIWNHFHAAVGSLPGERRVGLWNPEESIDTTTLSPCNHEVAKEGKGGPVWKDNHVVQTESGEQASLVHQKSGNVLLESMEPVNIQPGATAAASASASAVPQAATLAQLGDTSASESQSQESATSPLTMEAYLARSKVTRHFVSDDLESSSSPVALPALMRRAEERSG